MDFATARPRSSLTTSHGGYEQTRETAEALSQALD